MSAHHVLLLGGHGKVAQHLTPLLLRRGWAVTSVIRNPDQVADVEKLRGPGPGAAGGRLTVLVRSLEDIKTEADAKVLLDEVKPDYVVWSAGMDAISLYLSHFTLRKKKFKINKVQQAQEEKAVRNGRVYPLNN